MSEALTIGRMAALVGVSTHTLRYYEQAGLMRPVARTNAGHRLYARGDVDWVRFVMRLKATGMSIAGMQAFAALRARGAETVAERRALILEHREHVRAQLAQLRSNLAAIEQKIIDYDAMMGNAPADDMTRIEDEPQNTKDTQWTTRSSTQTTNASHADGTS
ncbi:MerR family transcriptional regulator [Trinickia fusca]|uniref:MerR family transcriptional regulator n=1 Tax=Trinickia fusca TaxID=2419777 RepID=A0A494XWC5_9BURK|nr:MerR family transcriptional regulator [Trinickia fusca]RKP52404.1 MerR family transcriptional regulator [Trinickia fusca]